MGTKCVNATGCRFDPYSRKWNIYLSSSSLYFHFFISFFHTNRVYNQRLPHCNTMVSNWKHVTCIVLRHCHPTLLSTTGYYLSRNYQLLYQYTVIYSIKSVRIICIYCIYQFCKLIYITYKIDVDLSLMSFSNDYISCVRYFVYIYPPTY